jgi:hypothetical protein
MNEYYTFSQLYRMINSTTDYNGKQHVNPNYSIPLRHPTLDVFLFIRRNDTSNPTVSLFRLIAIVKIYNHWYGMRNGYQTYHS